MNYIALGKNTKKYRHIAGLGQEDLAELCDCSTSHIGQIEHARTVPSLDMTMRIANALSVTIDQLAAESYTHPEQIYLKEIAERIEKYSTAKKITICESLSSYLDSLEKFEKLK